MVVPQSGIGKDIAGDPVKRIFLVLSSAAFALSCAAASRAPVPLPEIVGAPAPNLEGQAHGRDAALSNTEEGALLKLATRNADAAFRLSIHYDATGADARAQRWRANAARLGHPIALYNAWYEQRLRRECVPMREALRWLEKSAARGHAAAREVLGPYRRSVSGCVAD